MQWGKCRRFALFCPSVLLRLWKLCEWLAKLYILRFKLRKLNGNKSAFFQDAIAAWRAHACKKACTKHCCVVPSAVMFFFVLLYLALLWFCCCAAFTPIATVHQIEVIAHLCGCGEITIWCALCSCCPGFSYSTVVQVALVFSQQQMIWCRIFVGMNSCVLLLAFNWIWEKWFVLGWPPVLRCESRKRLKIKRKCDVPIS